jgi:uncharacterized membrane protein YfcA
MVKNNINLSYINIIYYLCSKYIQKVINMKIKHSSFNIRNSIIGIFTGFINGIFGSGGGTLLVPI